MPFYKRDGVFFQLEACDAVRMYTAAGIEVNVAGIEEKVAGTEVNVAGTGKHGTVSVTGYEMTMIFYSPVGKPLFNFGPETVILGSAGWVRDAQLFQWLPKVSYQKACQSPKGGVQHVCLMTMG